MTHGGKIGAFVESSPHPAWLASSDGICTYANPALQRLTGLNSHQIELHDWLRFVVDEDREAARTSWKLSVATQHLIVPGFALWDLTAFRLKSSSQRSATRLIGAWDSHIPLLHPDDHGSTRNVWATCLRTGVAGKARFRARGAMVRIAGS